MLIGLIGLIWLPSVCCGRYIKAQEHLKDQGAKSKFAYVTFLYGEDFVLGVRVLGQSIRETGTKHDLVLVVTGKIQSSSLKTLQDDGWRVLLVDQISNPAKGPQKKGFPDKFVYVYTKLSVFNLVEYSKVVYLDADTIMTANSDELFKCPGFCAALRHSERFNSGVMVITPSVKQYEDMISKIEVFPSYTGGDQGFLNAYFKDFMNGLVFDPSQSYISEHSTMRLPTKFNADIGLYVLNSNRWMIPENEIHIVHFTLGPIKPWQWWSSWVIKDVKRWDGYRSRLPRDSLGYSHGNTGRQEFSKWWMTLIPFVACAVVARRYYVKGSMGALGSSASLVGLQSSGANALSAWSSVPKWFPGFSIFTGYTILVFSLGLSMWLVPQQIYGFWGWFLLDEWIIFIQFILFAAYLQICYRWGQRMATVAQPSQRNAFGPKPWRTTLKSALTIIVLTVLSPWAADLFLVKNFVFKVIVTAVTAVVANVVLTHSYASLGIRWCACGRSEANVKSVDSAVFTPLR